MAGPDPSFDPFRTRDAFFRRIVQQHSLLLYRVAHSVLRNPADAEDAVAEALLKLLRTGAWQGITNERAFLTRVVWRAALDRLAARSPAGDLDADEVSLIDHRASPERHSVASEQLSLLHALIDRLPLELREPLLLSAVDELNSREIGETMHLPEGTVRTRLMRARAVLREQYQTYTRTNQGQEVAARGPRQ